MFQPAGNNASASMRPEHSEIRASDWDVLATYWYPVARVQDVGDEPISTKLLDVQLAVFRGNDGLSVVLDRCPHRWVKLSAGKVVNGNIECPYHALQFSGSGQCVHMPGALRTSNSEKIPRSYRVASFPVVEKYGLVWTCLDPENGAKFPDFPGLDGHKLLMIEPRDVPCSSQRQIENFFDLGHLPIVHQPSLGGDVDAPIAPGKISTVEDGVLQMIASYDENPMGEGVRPVKYTHRITVPFVADLLISDNDGEARFVNIATPVSAFECRAYQVLIDSADASEHHANVISATNQVNDEDKRILENTPRVSMRLDGRGEIHMAIDNMSLAYRRALLKTGLGH